MADTPPPKQAEHDASSSSQPPAKHAKVVASPKADKPLNENPHLAYHLARKSKQDQLHPALAHASLMESAVVLAEHEFHEMRLAAIATGRSTSGMSAVNAATRHSRSTTRATTRATASSAATWQEEHDRQLAWERHQRAVNDIKARHSKHPVLPKVQGASSTQHRLMASVHLDDDNISMADRIYKGRGLIPTAAQCAAMEQRRRRYVNQMRKVPDVPRKPAEPPLPDDTLPAVAALHVPQEEQRKRDLELRWNVDTGKAGGVPKRVGAFESTVPELPAITDGHGRTYVTPRGRTSRAHHASTADDGKEEKPAKTARLRLPPTVPQRPPKSTMRRPPVTSTGFADALTRNPLASNNRPQRVRGPTLEETEQQETDARADIAAEADKAFENTTAAEPAGANDAKKRQKRREEAEAVLREKLDVVEHDEEEARDRVEDEEERAWAAVGTKADAGAKKAEEDAAARVERERRAARRKLDAGELEEQRARDDVEADETNGFAGIKKQWRKLQLEGEEQAALDARRDAVERVTSVEGPYELIFAANGNFTKDGDKYHLLSLPRLLVDDDGAVTTGPRPEDGEDHLISIEATSDGHAIVRLASGERTLASEGDKKPMCAVSTSVAKAENTVFVVENVANDAAEGCASFSLALRSLPDAVVAAVEKVVVVTSGGKGTATLAAVPRSRCDALVQQRSDEETKADADRVAAEEAERACKARDARAAAVEKAFGALPTDPLEIFPAEAGHLRLLRVSDDAKSKLAVDDRVGSNLDCFVVRDAGDGYVRIVGDDGDVVVGLSNGGKRALRVFASSDEAASTSAVEFEVIALDDAARFSLGPRAEDAMVVEAQLDTETRRLVPVPIDESTNFCELSHISKAEADEQSAVDAQRQHSLEAAVAREEAVLQIVGDIEEMTIYEILPDVNRAVYTTVASPDDGTPVVGADKASGGDTQAFVFADIGDGYVTLIPWSAPKSAVTATEPHKPAVVVASADETTGQALELVPVETGGFHMLPRAFQGHALSMTEGDDGTWALRLMPYDRNTDASNTAFTFRLSLKEASGTLGSPMSPTSDVSDEYEPRRIEAVKAIVGDISAVEVFELMPFDKQKLRFTALPPEEGADVGAGATLALRTRHSDSTSDQAFVFFDAGGGWVHIVPWFDTAMALEVTPELDGLFVTERSDRATQLFEFLPLEALDDDPDARQPFSLVPKSLPTHTVEASIDVDGRPVRLASEASNLCELLLITRDEAEEQLAARANQKRRASQLASLKRRHDAIVGVIGDVGDAPKPYHLVPHDDTTRKLAWSPEGGLHAVKEADDVSALCVVFNIFEDGDAYITITPATAPEGHFVTAPALGERVVVAKPDTDARHHVFEVVLLEEPGAFCIDPKAFNNSIVEMQLNDGGDLVLLHEDQASSFSELLAVPVTA